MPGLNPLAIALDTLHTWDLGISCHLLGSLLWDLLEDTGHGNRDERWKAIYEEIGLLYDEMDVAASQRIGRLKWKDIAKSTSVFPSLKHVKGRRVRHFVPVCLRLAERYREACLRYVKLCFVVPIVLLLQGFFWTLKLYPRTRTLSPSIASWPLKLWRTCMHLGCLV